MNKAMRTVSALLVLICLAVWGSAALAQQGDPRYARLEELLRGKDQRPIYLSAYQAVPDSGELFAVYATVGDLSQPAYTTDYALWFVHEGREPQLLFDGQNQEEPEDEWLDNRVYLRGRLQAFVHGHRGYFITSTETGERQSSAATLYMVRDGAAIEVRSFWMDLLYHPDAGLVHMKPVYATEASIEASLTLIPVFLSLEEDQVTPGEGLPISIEDLHLLTNGEQIARDLRGYHKALDSLYYLPNNMLLANFREFYDEDVIFTMALWGIRQGQANLVRPPNSEMSIPDTAAPYWQPAGNLSGAEIDGIYEPAGHGQDETIRPAGFLMPRADRMVCYGLESFSLAEALLQLTAPAESAAQQPADGDQLAAQASLSKNPAYTGETVSLFLSITGGTPPYSYRVLPGGDVDQGVWGEGDSGRMDFYVRPGLRTPEVFNVWVEDSAGGQADQLQVPLTIEGGLQEDEVVRVLFDRFTVAKGTTLTATVEPLYNTGMGTYQPYFIAWYTTREDGSESMVKREPKRGFFYEPEPVQTFTLKPSRGIRARLEVGIMVPDGQEGYYTVAGPSAEITP